MSALGFASVYAVCKPGFMSPDSVNQLRQARALEFSDDHPPLMAMLWALVDRVIEGPLGMLLFINALYWASLTVVFRHWPSSRRVRWLAALFVAFYPPLWVNLGVIWKDILMQGALLGLVGAYLSYRSSRSWLPLAWVPILSLLAIGARHNAAAAVWPLLILLFREVPYVGRLRTHRRRLAALALATASVVLFQQSLVRGMRPFVRETHFWQVLAFYDISAMSLYEEKVLFKPEDGVLRKGASLDELRSAFNAFHPLRLYDCGRRCKAPLRMTDEPKKLAALSRRWRQAILQHPESYWRTRRKVYRRLIGLTGMPYVAYPRIDDNPWGYELAPSSLRDTVMGAMDALIDWHIYRAFPYMLAALAAIGIAFSKRRQGGAALPIALATSGLVYHLTFLVFTASDDYRYSLWTLLSAILAVLALPAGLPSPWRPWLRIKEWLSRFTARRPVDAPSRA